MVVRATLARQASWRERVRIHRVVMIAPPSRGSRMAKFARDLPLVPELAGPSVEDLTPEEAETLPPPPVEFGIIAGAKGDGGGWNPFLAGDDDGVVSVEEARLPGAQDFLVVPAFHTVIMDHPRVIEATLSFLERGAFTPPPAGR